MKLSGVDMVSEMKLLLDVDPELLSRQFGYYIPLSYAINSNKPVELLKYLARMTPDVNQQSSGYSMCSGGETPMDVAIDCFNEVAVKILLVNKADPNLLSSVCILQHTGAPYLIKAAMQLRQIGKNRKKEVVVVRMVKHLVEAKADINAKYTFTDSCEGFTVLDVAVSNQNLALTKYLLSKGGKMGLKLSTIKEMHSPMVLKPRLLFLLKSFGIELD
jgi:ankyrin repeat protein